MKPRHLKEKDNKLQNNKNSAANSTKNKKSNEPSFIEKSQLFSNLIPFRKTKEYYEFLEWISNWSQSQPACILFGPTSCGKSSIIQYASSELLCHVIEIDCASISGIKELVSTFHESTKSRSVGIFLNHDNSNYDDAISMVVLEHVDSIISSHNPPPSSIINMISKSLVPLIMTSQYPCLQPAEWLKIIPVYCIDDPFSVIKTAQWLKDSINKLSTNEAIHSLLSFTDQDIRRTSLQYQVWGDVSNSILTRSQQIYLSIPICVGEKISPKEKRDFYADSLDFFLSVDHNNQIFDSYIRPISRTFTSRHREQLFRDYVDFSKTRVKHTSFGDFEDLELTELVYLACVNDIPVTRNSTKPALPPGHKIKPNELQFVKSWDIWPNILRDIKSEPQSESESQREVTIKTENEDKVKTLPEPKIENEAQNLPENETEIQKENETENQKENEAETENKNENENGGDEVREEKKERGRGRGRGRGRPRGRKPKS